MVVTIKSPPPVMYRSWGNEGETYLRESTNEHIDYFNVNKSEIAFFSCCVSDAVLSGAGNLSSGTGTASRPLHRQARRSPGSGCLRVKGLGQGMRTPAFTEGRGRGAREGSSWNVACVSWPHLHLPIGSVDRSCLGLHANGVGRLFHRRRDLSKL